MYLGREAMGADRVPVFTMPKMRFFLESNGPWDQLIQLNNIEIAELHHEGPVLLTDQITVVPFLVPHRDEYSETVGYKIIGPNRSVLFIPDIDKWSVWQTPIESEITEVDYAFIDATFFDEEEVNRDISEIPHPFVVESMELLSALPDNERNKVFFIHLNHTNPLLNPSSEQSKRVESLGFHVARIYQEFEL
jgi:pyrroloquinoline quinone biosynthesis protein B